LVSQDQKQETELLISVLQMCAGDCKADNLKEAENLILQACSTKAHQTKKHSHLLCLPEVFNMRAQTAEENNAAAENIPDGQTYHWAAEMAKRFACYLLAGSILERNDIDKPFNTSFVIDPQGRLVAKYRKINLFQFTPDNDAQQSASLCEPKFRSAGNKPVFFDAPWGRTGLAICFDLRFPELFVNYRKHDCKLVLLPSAFTYTTGQVHWETLCKARAIENQLFFVAPNQSGKANCWGHSCVINPWGQVVAMLEEEDKAYLQCEIDFSEVEIVRRKIDMQKRLFS